MTNEATLDKLQQMKLTGMLAAFRQTMESNFARNFTADELLAHLVDAEWDDRHNRKLARLLKNANFRYQACFEQIDFNQPREMDKNLLLRLSGCDWLSKAENVLIIPLSGTWARALSPQPSDTRRV